MKIKVEDLETERLLLRKFKESDAQDYVDFMSDKKVRLFMHTLNWGREEYLKFYETVVAGYRKRKNPNMNFAIELKTNHKVIGHIVVGANWKDNYFKLGWGIGSKYWGKGYAYEAAKAVMDHIFNNYDFHRVQADVWAGNTRSINLALRLGFKEEGVSRDAIYNNGKYIDDLHFGLLRSEWEENA